MDRIQKLITALLLLCTPLLMQGNLSKTLFSLPDEPIDIMIPCTEKDLETLPLCIKMAKKNIVNLRRIIIVSREKLTDSAEWFDEANYPFTKDEVAFELTDGKTDPIDFLKNGNRTGWYYQQLLKLYAHIVIPDLSSNLLLLDSDTFFLKKTRFTNKRNGGLFAIATEHHTPYYFHMKRLIPGLIQKKSDQSGVTHHMLIQRPILLDLLSTIENAHGIEPWKAFCRLVDPEHLTKSGASEYEIYFNYAQHRTNQVEIRPLRWKNIRRLKDIKKYKKKGYDYVSCHSWQRS